MVPVSLAGVELARPFLFLSAEAKPPLLRLPPKPQPTSARAFRCKPACGTV